MTDNISRIKDGFLGERMAYLPGKIKKRILEDVRIRDLYITHIGHFPYAKGHYRNRKRGALQYILFFCRDGKGWVTIDGEKYTIEKNQVFIIPPNSKCKYGASEKVPWDNYWIHFTGEYAELYTPPILSNIPISITINSRIEDRVVLFEEMLQNMEQYSNFDNVVYANICLKYFLTTIKQLNNYLITENNTSYDYFSIALLYMKNNLKKRLTLQELSSVCKCSESNLYKVFMKRLNCAPIEYFIQLRIQRSCKYLIDTKMKVKDIANEMGYDDPYYFSRLFSKLIGKSPKQYREEES